jgi:hypothetical protein
MVVSARSGPQGLDVAWRERNRDRELCKLYDWGGATIFQ